ncbi:MAG: IS3 family transposase [Alicyclobacillus shizuokensis]|nr:IS3 family transposase [Alicyclobacillus shizuokensis]
MAQHYDKDFKTHVVRMVLEEGKSATQVARELDIPVKTVYGWIAKYKENPEHPFVGSGHLRPEDQRIRDMERELRELREENAIFKKSHSVLCERPEVKYRFIHEHRFEFRVQKMCDVLGVSRSGYYTWLRRPVSGRAKRRRQLTRRIYQIFVRTRRLYGSPKITQLLRREGVRVGQKTVARIMREHGLRSRVVRKYKATTDSNHAYPVHDNRLNQSFEAERPNQIWMADITYVPTEEGWLYVASIMDLFTRKIVGWHADSRMTKALVIKALEQAVCRERPKGPVLHHSDRGSQYASHDYQQKLREYGMIPSMSRRGNCYDNACMESFHSVLKRELVYQEKFKTRDEAKRRIWEYIEVWYNRQRIHSSLGYMTPMEFEKAYNQKRVSLAG